MRHETVSRPRTGADLNRSVHLAGSEAVGGVHRMWTLMRNLVTASAALPGVCGEAMTARTSAHVAALWGGSEKKHAAALQMFTYLKLG